MSKIIMPGEEIEQEKTTPNYSYTDEKGTYASVISLQTEDGKIIPLEGPYQPTPNDYVIGHVSDVKFGGYEIDINSPYKAFLPMANAFNLKLSLGDIIIAKVKSVNEVRDVELEDPRILKNGVLIRITPLKVPRLIGKRNSMLNILTYATETKIYVGKNGLVFISQDGNYTLAIEAIKIIEKQAHVQGLTQKIADFLAQKTNKQISIEDVQQKSQTANYILPEKQNNSVNYYHKSRFETSRPRQKKSFRFRR